MQIVQRACVHEGSWSCSTGCAAKHAEARRTLHTHPLSSASSLKPAHTATLYYHSQMILLHFQLEGNVHILLCERILLKLRATCVFMRFPNNDSWRRMRGRARLFRTTNTVSEENAKYFPDPQPLRNWPQGHQLQKQKTNTLSLAVCWLVWVCPYMLTARTHLGFPETISGCNIHFLYPVCYCFVFV